MSYPDISAGSTRIRTCTHTCYALQASQAQPGLAPYTRIAHSQLGGKSMTLLAEFVATSLLPVDFLSASG